jgi:DNA-damage-inducible protein J
MIVMASMTSAINVNVPIEVKEEANLIFNNLGLNMSTAINMFLKKTIYERGIPFDVKEPTPSKEFLEALKELDYMEKHPSEYKAYDNIEDLKKALLSDD